MPRKTPPKPKSLFTEGQSYRTLAEDKPIRFKVKKSHVTTTNGYQLIETTKGAFIFSSYDPEKPELINERLTAVRVYKDRLGFVEFFASGADPDAARILEALGENTEKYWKEV